MLITFEGGEGSGKTTQIALLGEWLKNQGHRVTATREPGGTGIGQKIRSLLLDPDENPCDHTELLLFYAARAQLIHEVILPALSEGQVVLLDRFTDSTLVYQGHARGLPRDFITELNTRIASQCQPHLTLLLDIEVEKGLKRVQNRGKLNRLDQESLHFHHTVRQGFLAEARLNPQRWKVIDAAKEEKAVQQDIQKTVTELLCSVH